MRAILIIVFPLLTLNLGSQNYLSSISSALAKNDIHKILCYTLDSTGKTKIISRVLFLNDKGLVIKEAELNTLTKDTVSFTFYQYDSLKRMTSIKEKNFSAEIYYNKSNVSKTIKHEKDSAEEVSYKYFKFFNREITKAYRNGKLTSRKVKKTKSNVLTTKIKNRKLHSLEWEKQYHDENNNVVKTERYGSFYLQVNMGAESGKTRGKKCDYIYRTTYEYNQQNLQVKMNLHASSCQTGYDSYHLFEYLK